MNTVYLTEEANVQVNPREGLERLSNELERFGNEHYFAQVGSLLSRCAPTALWCIRIKQKPSSGCKYHLPPHWGASVLPQQCKSLYCWSVRVNQHQPGVRISPSKDTVIWVPGHLIQAELVPLPQSKIPGEALWSLDRSVHPIYAMHPAEGNLKVLFKTSFVTIQAANRYTEVLTQP